MLELLYMQATGRVKVIYCMSKILSERLLRFVHHQPLCKIARTRISPSHHPVKYRANPAQNNNKVHAGIVLTFCHL